mmetsp:Transcript_26765/g.75632  ORF Transcript_26765/g.75632 Transcript_26765/m.75632 type:complete len:721 (-) Transcript_26765:170-2332(-)
MVVSAWQAPSSHNWFTSALTSTRPKDSPNSANSESSVVGTLSSTYVVWQWEHRTGFRNYDKEACLRIEQAYSRGDSHVRLKSGKTGNLPMELFFRTDRSGQWKGGMVQNDPKSNHQRAIKRLGNNGVCQKLTRKFAEVVRSIETGKWQLESFEEYNRHRQDEVNNTRPEKEPAHVWFIPPEGDQHQSRCQKMMKTRCFSCFSFMIVALNALWIFIEAEMNPAATVIESEPFYQVVEVIFCFVFLVEICIRFGAFPKKKDCLNDGWFLFDMILVICSIGEIMVLTVVVFIMCHGSNENCRLNKSIGRLGMFRLLRVTRISRLLRFFPEMYMLIKGITRAMRSVVSTLVLLLVLIAVFGIGFKNMARGDPDVEPLFYSVRASMWILLIQGTFLDEVGMMMDPWAALRWDLALLFIVFIFLSSFTVLNMLIGILCEVVHTTSRAEREKAAILKFRSHLYEILESHDSDNDGHIEKDEFELLMKNPGMHLALLTVGVDIDNLMALKDVMFEPGDVRFRCQGGLRRHETRRTLRINEGHLTRRLSFNEFIDIVLGLRGGNNTTVSDIVYLREYIDQRLNQMEQRFQERSAGGPLALARGSSPTMLQPPSPRSPSPQPQLPALQERRSEHMTPTQSSGNEDATTVASDRTPREHESIASVAEPIWGEAVLHRLNELFEGQKELRTEMSSLRDEVKSLHGIHHFHNSRVGGHTTAAHSWSQTIQLPI